MPSVTNPPAPLPHGMSDVDYEAIEMAVTETVRGRWFLAEFARRNRGAEVKLMLDAMGRLEDLVTRQAQAAALPPSADPSIRLMVQRIKEIAASLEAAARSMRESGLEAAVWEPVDQQARAVAGLMRAGAPAEVKAGPPPQVAPAAPASGQAAIGQAASQLAASQLAASQLAAPASEPAAAAGEPRRLPRVDARSADPRLQAFSGLDGLSLPQKVSFFT